MVLLSIPNFHVKTLLLHRFDRLLMTGFDRLLVTRVVGIIALSLFLCRAMPVYLSVDPKGLKKSMKIQEYLSMRSHTENNFTKSYTNLCFLNNSFSIDSPTFLFFRLSSLPLILFIVRINHLPTGMGL